MGTTTVVNAVVAAAVVGALAGCASPQQAATPSQSTGATTENADQAARRQALTAYQGMWTAVKKAGLTSNSADPDLAKYASSNALATITKKLTMDRASGLVTKGDIGIQPKVSSVAPPNAPTVVNIVDCADDSRWLRYRKDNGAPADTPGGRHRVTAIVQQIGGWRVTSFALDDRAGSC
ncbi:hypothetical protein [Fodinicola acaciae]|uniref:hypothetical protein n=1 Tax=Fodinicola acaciae TaxID=2681555 RepID=UPI0013D169EC|nr:hypothetical protein [Fodinicola acaciae]